MLPRWNAENIAELQKRLDAYFEECAAKDKTPHIVDCAIVAGIARARWYEYMESREDVPAVVRDTFKRAHERCVASLTTGLIDGKTTPVGKIFIGKALYGMRDGSEDDGKRNAQSFQVVINTTPEALGMATAQVIEATRVVDALPVNNTADMQTVDADR